MNWIVLDEVPKELWMKLTHQICDCNGAVTGFLFFDPGIDGYSIMPSAHPLRPAVFGKSLKDAIAVCKAFQCPVTEYKAAE